MILSKAAIIGVSSLFTVSAVGFSAFNYFENVHAQEMEKPAIIAETGNTISDSEAADDNALAAADDNTPATANDNALAVANESALAIATGNVSAVTDNNRSNSGNAPAAANKASSNSAAANKNSNSSASSKNTSANAGNKKTDTYRTVSHYTDDYSTLLRVEYYDNNNKLVKYSDVTNYDKNTNSYTETVYHYDYTNDVEVKERTDTYVNGEVTSSETP